MVTHELNTPITAAKAFAQLLFRSLQKEDLGAHALFLGKIDTQLNRLNKLIVDLLDATRVGNGKMHLQKK